jgi:23S rRNA (cytosine1962-C5)-methyltransferase
MMFQNRLAKRYKHLRKWASRWPTEAYRLYDRDIPEYSWTVDIYRDHVHLQEYERRLDQEILDARREEVMTAVREVLQIPDERIFYKHRKPQVDGFQYGKQAEDKFEMLVREGELSFWVNLSDYIDTGLFLDHRPLRRIVADQIRQLSPSRATPLRVLNLFSYTGAFSVWAAAAGAHTTTVDMSKRYLEWAERNFEANELDHTKHGFIREDIVRWLQGPAQHLTAFDIIILDPPSASRSKNMDGDFEVQRDHGQLILNALRLLAPGGSLYFSTNYRRFEINTRALAGRHVEEITDQTIPEDFRPGIHRSFLIM